VCIGPLDSPATIELSTQPFEFAAKLVTVGKLRHSDTGRQSKLARQFISFDRCELLSHLSGLPNVGRPRVS
jgi:hypothetical protein